MRIYVKVFTRSGLQSLKEVSRDQWEARLISVPEKGRANEELIKLLAKKFHIAKSNIIIVAGKTAKIKIIDIKLKNDKR